VSNFTDVDALAHEPEVTVTWLEVPRRLSDYQAVLIPGSKSVIYDMTRLRLAGWPRALEDYLADSSGVVAGLCGGYQMLGRRIEDPGGVEGQPSACPGLGLLDITTRIETIKQVRLSAGTDRLYLAAVTGYEIHMGRTGLGSEVQPFLDLDNGTDGAVSPDGTPRAEASPASALSHWPVQIHLVPPTAPFLKGAHLLVAADCVPVAFPGFQTELLPGKAVMIGCPKFDDRQSYVDKFTQIFKTAGIKSVTCVRMEVPCCSGLPMIIREAMRAAGVGIPMEEMVVSARGAVLERKRI